MAAGFGEFRIELDRLPEIFQPLAVLAVALVEQPQIEARLGVLGIDSKRALEQLASLRRILIAGVDAEVNERVDMARIELERFLILGGSGGFAGLGAVEREREVVVCVHRRRVSLSSLLQSGDRLFPGAALSVSDAQLHQDARVIALNLAGVAEFQNGGIPLALLGELVGFVQDCSSLRILERRSGAEQGGKCEREKPAHGGLF